MPLLYCFDLKEKMDSKYIIWLHLRKRVNVSLFLNQFL